jgi:hypothetical protein
MAITLSSSSLTQQNAQVEIDRVKQIEECNYLLRRLKKGTYSIPWDGIIPIRKNQHKSIKEKKLEIVVESSIEYGKFIYPRKPYLTRVVKIGGRDASSIRSWQAEQLGELNHKLKQLITSKLNESS